MTLRESVQSALVVELMEELAFHGSLELHRIGPRLPSAGLRAIRWMTMMGIADTERRKDGVLILVANERWQRAREER